MRAASRMRSPTTDSGSSPSPIEQRLQRGALDERHDEQRWHVGRIAGVLPEHVGNGHRGAVQRPDEARLAQHVAIEHRRQPRRRNLDHDAPPTGDGRVREARSATGERCDVVGTERREPMTQVIEVELPCGHVRSIATHAWSMCREGRTRDGREPRARQGRRRTTRRGGRHRRAHRADHGPRREVRRLAARDPRRHPELRAEGRSRCRPTLSSAEERERLMAEVIEQVGAPDILVNNAAVTFLRPLDEFPEKRARLMLEMHVLAPLHLTQLAIPAMRERKQGWVLMMTSVAGDRIDGPPFSDFDTTAGFGMYGTVKAALSRLTQSFAAELYDDGIAVNAAAPSNPVATPGAGTLDLAKEDTEDISLITETAFLLCTGDPSHAHRARRPHAAVPARSGLAHDLIAPAAATLTERISMPYSAVGRVLHPSAAPHARPGAATPRRAGRTAATSTCTRPTARSCITNGYGNNPNTQSAHGYAKVAPRRRPALGPRRRSGSAPPIAATSTRGRCAGPVSSRCSTGSSSSARTPPASSGSCTTSRKAPMWELLPITIRKQGRAIVDMHHIKQPGRYTGWVKIDGERDLGRRLHRRARPHLRHPRLGPGRLLAVVRGRVRRPRDRSVGVGVVGRHRAVRRRRDHVRRRHGSPSASSRSSTTSTFDGDRRRPVGAQIRFVDEDGHRFDVAATRTAPARQRELRVGALPTPDRQRALPLRVGQQRPGRPRRGRVTNDLPGPVDDASSWTA